MNRITFLTALLVAATLGNAQTPAREVSNDKYGFRFEVPDNFVQIEEEGDFILYQFGTHQPTPNKPATVVKFERLGGTIDPDESVDPMHWESAFHSKVNVVKAQWSGFTLDLVHTKLESAGTPMYLYLVQIPLEPEAIQLIVGGPENATARKLFLNTLKSIRVNHRPFSGVPTRGQSQATSNDVVTLGNRVARYNKSTGRLHDFKHECSVSMPDVPRLKDHTGNAGAALPVYMYVLEHESELYSLTLVVPPKEMLRGVDLSSTAVANEAINEFLDSVIRAKPGYKVRLRRNIELDRISGIEAAFTYPEGKNSSGPYLAGVAFVRCYFHEGNLYSVQVDVTENAYRTSAEEYRSKMIAYLDSFSFHGRDNP